MRIKSEIQQQEKLKNEESEDSQMYQQRYAKYLAETCQEIFAPYYTDNNFNFALDFQNHQFQGSVTSHLEQISNQLQKGPLLIGSIKALSGEQSPAQDQWVVLE